jgi:hypothetical protein
MKSTMIDNAVYRRDTTHSPMMAESQPSADRFKVHDPKQVVNTT